MNHSCSPFTSIVSLVKSLSFCSLATCRVSNEIASTLSLYSLSCLSILDIFWPNWFYTKKLLRASSIYTFFSLSRSLLGWRNPITSLLAWRVSIYLLARAIYRNIFVCSDFTSSTASCSYRTFMGFICCNIFWKSSPILKFTRTVLILLSYFMEKSLSTSNLVIFSWRPISSCSQCLTRVYTSVKLLLKRLSLVSMLNFC